MVKCEAGSVSEVDSCEGRNMCKRLFGRERPVKCKRKVNSKRLMKCKGGLVGCWAVL